MRCPLRILKNLWHVSKNLKGYTHVQVWVVHTSGKDWEDPKLSMMADFEVLHKEEVKAKEEL